MYFVARCTLLFVSVRLLVATLGGQQQAFFFSSSLVEDELGCTKESSRGSRKIFSCDRVDCCGNAGMYA